MKHVWLPSLLALWLGGCAAAPSSAPKPFAAPSGWMTTTATSDGRAEAAWWKELGDVRLDEWIEQAWRDGADVQVLVARLEQAQAMADAAVAARRPQFDYGVAASRERIPESKLRDGEGFETTVAPARRSLFSAQLSGRYEIDLLGRLALARKAADASVAASESDLKALRQWLAAEVVQACAELRRTEHDSAVAALMGTLLEELLDSAREQLSAGIVARDAVREAERRLADNRDAQIALARQRHTAFARLALLLGRAPAQLSVDPDEFWLKHRPVSGAVIPDLPAAVIVQRADVAAAWQRVESAAASARSTNLERYPSFALTGNGGFVSEAFRRWFAGDALSWVAQAAIQGPLLDGGRQRTRFRQAEGAMQEAYAQYRKAALQALAEVETALSATQAAREHVELAKAELSRRQADREDIEAGRAAGLESRPDWVRTELARVQAEAALQARRFELLLAWLSAQRALGH